MPSPFVSCDRSVPALNSDQFHVKTIGPLLAIALRKLINRNIEGASLPLMIWTTSIWHFSQFWLLEVQKQVWVDLFCSWRFRPCCRQLFSITLHGRQNEKANSLEFHLWRHWLHVFSVKPMWLHWTLITSWRLAKWQETQSWVIHHSNI